MMQSIKCFFDKYKNRIIGILVSIILFTLLIYEVVNSGVIENWWNSLTVEVQATIIIVAILVGVLLIVGVGMFFYIKLLRHLGGIAGKKLNNSINDKFKERKKEIGKNDKTIL